MPGRLVGWGYQGQTLNDLIQSMQESGATHLIDVRMTPISRIKGFSKSRLREHLDSHGFTYEHLPQLGNPKENRPSYANPDTPAARHAHRRYMTEVLDSESGEKAIHYLSSLIEAEEVVYLLCFESDQRCCHREQIIDEVDRLRRETFFTAMAIAG
ncbi:DUF488 domain-containing protein [Actinomyces sp. ZJ308]|uniref:DUF488 domain-containing protein n=1 Tax=Actinomyces sp. ZJ308 TaxID=2708342 RepID=UPI0014239572|nr:DUF488 domain-containing protein [Actinomyces sp. ZJ308]